MKKLTDVCQIAAFTDSAFNGNPAGVVYSENLSNEEMQLIAREFNVSETAFISNGKEADYNLKWFSPTVEIKLCGHATIASVHFLREQGMIPDNSTITFKTLSGILKCKTSNGVHSLFLPIPKLSEFTGNKIEIVNALSAHNIIDTEKFPFILDDGGYLYIKVSSLEGLMNIKPDFKKLNKLSSEGNGYDAFTLFTTETIEKGNDAHLRFFAPYYGINEDPVTGSANGPLLLVLSKLGLIENPFANGTEEKIFNFEQGDAIGRKGRIQVTYSSLRNELMISGHAFTVFKGELIF